MNRGLANVRQIEGQKVESEREITGSEAEEILRRYGHGEPQRYSTHQETQEPQKKPLTFEEMIKQQEEEKKAEEQRKQAKLNGPKPITFNGQNGYETEVKHDYDEELGFGFKIEISTDMKLPK